MESFDKPELEKSKNENQSETSSPAGCSYKVEESKCMNHKEISAKRKSSFKSSSSTELLTTTSTDEEDDETDESYSEGILTYGEKGNLSASKWQYADLKNINIFYNEKPDTIKELLQDIKIDILKKCPTLPDEKTVERYCNFTKENVLFSYSFEKIVNGLNMNSVDKMLLEQDIVEDIQSDLERAEELDKSLDLTNWLDRKWFGGVKDFLASTVSLIKTILYPTTEDESVTKKLESIKRKKKRKHRERKQERQLNLERVYKEHCEMFGGLFFLKKKGVMKRTIVVGDKIVRSIPDITYPLASIPLLGYTLQNCSLLIVVEVKGKPIYNVSSERLEDQLDSYVLGQVGSELFTEAKTSAMYPNSLGMICMETKFIFAYLKMPKEHRDIKFPLTTKGNIHYTRPFEMLKAEDRAEVCEFMYWLGCIQNHCGTKILEDYRIGCKLQGKS